MLENRNSHKSSDCIEERKAAKRIRAGGISGRRFAPRVAELESRQLLSNLVVTSASDSGSGSLRAELSAAAPGDVITFANSLRGQTIALASPLAVGTSLTIKGFPQGPTISGNSATEILAISPGVSVNLNTLRMLNGSAVRGGAIDNSAHSSSNRAFS